MDVVNETLQEALLTSSTMCRSVLARLDMLRLVKFEYDPEKLDFGDMASFDFISTVCYKHALQVSHVDLTDSGVLACAYTKLKEWLVTDPQRTLGLCSACTGGTTLLPIGLVVNPAVMVYAGGVLLQDP